MDPHCIKSTRKCNKCSQEALLVAYLQLSCEGNRIEKAAIQRAIIRRAAPDRLEAAGAIEAFGRIVGPHFEENLFGARVARQFCESLYQQSSKSPSAQFGADADQQQFDGCDVGLLFQLGSWSQTSRVKQVGDATYMWSDDTISVPVDWSLGEQWLPVLRATVIDLRGDSAQPLPGSPSFAFNLAPLCLQAGQVADLLPTDCFFLAMHGAFI